MAVGGRERQRKELKTAATCHLALRGGDRDIGKQRLKGVNDRKR